MALDYFLKSVKISEEIKDRLGAAKYMIDLYSYYHAQGLCEKAIIGTKKSLEILDEIGDKLSYGRCLSSLGSIYSDIGIYPTALDYHFKALQIKESINDKSGILLTSINIRSIVPL